MKPGLSVAFPDRTVVEHHVALIAEAGFVGLEPTLVRGGLPDPDRAEADAAWLAGVATRHGLAIPSLRAGAEVWPLFASAEAAQRDRAVAFVELALRCLARLGGEVLLVVPGQWSPERTYADTCAAALDTARRLAPLAERHGLIIALENVPNRLFVTPSEWHTLIDAVGHPRIRMYFDCGNPTALGLGCPGQWLREIGRARIARVHFKDPTPHGPVLPLLSGGVPWTEVRRALREIGYDDWVCAEYDIPALLPAPQLRTAAAHLSAIWSLV